MKLTIVITLALVAAAHGSSCIYGCEGDCTPSTAEDCDAPNAPGSGIGDYQQYRGYTINDDQDFSHESEIVFYEKEGEVLSTATVADCALACDKWDGCIGFNYVYSFPPETYAGGTNWNTQYRCVGKAAPLQEGKAVGDTGKLLTSRDGMAFYSRENDAGELLAAVCIVDCFGDDDDDDWGLWDEKDFKKAAAVGTGLIVGIIIGAIFLFICLPILCCMFVCKAAKITP